jgi:bacteriocin-like protein
MSEKEPKAAPPRDAHGKKTDKGELSEKELEEVSGGGNPKPPEPPNPC